MKSESEFEKYIRENIYGLNVPQWSQTGDVNYTELADNLIEWLSGFNKDNLKVK